MWHLNLIIFNCRLHEWSVVLPANVGQRQTAAVQPSLEPITDDPPERDVIHVLLRRSTRENRSTRNVNTQLDDVTSF